LYLSGRTARNLDLDLTSSMAHCWLPEHNKLGDNSFKGNGNALLTPEQEEDAEQK